MGEKDIFKEINRILEDADMDLRISDLEQLEEFLEEYESEDLEFYEEIRDLYEQLLIGVGIW
ncbi:MAG: hypothetical protein GX270_01485 [Clostridiaceae bacterium]|nr:hypothetical protein [Clostridiaceae bacterium]